MIVKTKAFVLRTVNYSDTSIIATLFTKQLGLQSYLLRGARASKKSKLGNLFQPMQFLDLVVQHRENKSLQYVKECKADFVYQNLWYDIKKSAIGLFFLEVINVCAQEETSNEGFYNFIEQQFQNLDAQNNQLGYMPIVFLSKLAEQLGFQPYNNYSSTNHLFALEDGFFVGENDLYPNALNAQQSKLFAKFLNEKPFCPTLQERRELLQLWERYFQYHIMSFQNFKTPLIFEEVFS